MNRAEKEQERHQRRVRHVSGIMGAENIEGRSSASTGGASDLPELRSQEELDADWPEGSGLFVWGAVGLIAWLVAGGVLVWLV